VGSRLDSVAEAALRRLGGTPREARDPAPRFEIPDIPPPCPPTPEAERQVFEEILGASDPCVHSCFIEPGKPCVGCSGRCRTLGF
jgi:hypothetical protein